jgi:hypothetical protein
MPQLVRAIRSTTLSSRHESELAAGSYLPRKFKMAGLARHYCSYLYPALLMKLASRVVISLAARARMLRISPVAMVEIKDSGLAFHVLFQARMPTSSPVTLRCGPTRPDCSRPRQHVVSHEDISYRSEFN